MSKKDYAGNAESFGINSKLLMPPKAQESQI